jgi:hypothetical protein
MADELPGARYHDRYYGPGDPDMSEQEGNMAGYTWN